MRVDSVIRIEISAVDKRDANGSEVSGHYVVCLDSEFLIAGGAVHAQKRDGIVVDLTRNGAELRNRCGHDSGTPLESRQLSAVKIEDVGSLINIEVRQHNMIGGEA